MGSRALGPVLLASLALAVPARAATLAPAGEVNASRLAGAQHSPAIALDPADPTRLFVAATHVGDGLFAARSADGGASWLRLDPSDGTIADGADALPAAEGDPAVAWDGFGNLFLVYRGTGDGTIELALSTDGGASFAPLTTFLGMAVGRPSVVVGPGGATAPSSVWIAYVAGNVVVARGAPVTGRGVVGAFVPPGGQNPAGSAGGDFPELAIGPSGQVAVVYQLPGTGEGATDLRVHLDANGLQGGGFGPAVLAATTSVGGTDLIPAQPSVGIDAGAALAWDQSPGPYRGRLHLVYTAEEPDESDDTDVLLRVSDNAGATWSGPVRVNDDPPGRSQLRPRVAVDRTTGAVVVVWLDARADPANVAVALQGAASLDGGASFDASARLSAEAWPPPAGVDHGNRMGLAVQADRAVAAWTDGSNSTSDNPDGTAAPDVHVTGVAIVAECTLAADCDDGDACNGVETCAAGRCIPGAPATDGTACSDGNACTLADRCLAGECQGGTPLDCAPCLLCDPAAGCREALRTDCRRPIAPRKSRLLLRDRGVRDELAWVWKRGAATAVEDFGNPASGTDYELCLYDERGGVASLGLAAVVPPGGVCQGRPCWRATRKGFRFRDRDLTPEGLERLELFAGRDGKARIVLRGRSAALQLPELPLVKDPRVTVQLRAGGGPCWEAVYSGAARNDARRFKARSD